MNELEGMINSLMSNPEEMKKLMDMAGKILNPDSTGSSGKTEEQKQKAAPDLGSVLSGLGGAPSDSESSGDTATPNLDSILSSLNSIPGGLSGTVEKILGGETMQKLIKGGGLNQKDDKKELIEALKPWVSEKRRNKLDKAMTFAKVMRVAGVASVFKKGG
jgi:hypothetical protein